MLYTSNKSVSSNNTAPTMSSPTNYSSKTRKGLIGSDHSEADGTDDLSIGSTSDHQSTTGSIKPIKRKKSTSKPVKSKSSTANNNKNSSNNDDGGSPRRRSTSSRARKKNPQEKSKRRSSKIVAATDSSVNDDGDDDNDPNDDNNTSGGYNLNDEKTDDDGGRRSELGRSVFKSGRKLFDKAVRAVSPGRLSRSQRSKSPDGLSKVTSGMRSNSIRDRSKSPGRTKSRRKRSKSPGALKKRSESPGRHKNRAQGSERQKKRPQRRPSAVIDDDDDGKNMLGAMLDKDAESQPRRRGSRSIASEPVRKPQRQKSNEGLPQRKQRSVKIRPSGDGGGKTRRPTKSKSADAHTILGATNELSEDSSDDEDEEVSLASSSQGRDEMPSKPRRTSPPYKEEKTAKERSYSNMGDELARHKVRRNKSNPNPSPSPSQDLTAEEGDEGGGKPRVARRAESMMLHREAGRRNKQSSLMDLVQYKEEEIHSTSYFASNHVLINRERMKRGLKPLSRNIAMDDLARKSAQAMAASKGLNPLQTTYVGNVLRGESIRTIHRSTMLQKQGRERYNLLNPFFEDFGVGTCKGDDGMLYMCQLFSERLQLALTDTASEQNETKPS